MAACEFETPIGKADPKLKVGDHRRSMEFSTGTSIDKLGLKTVDRSWHQLSDHCTDNKIRIMQFNILARSLASQRSGQDVEHGFPHVSPDVLDWTRRRELLLAVILEHQPDVMVLEELDEFKWLFEVLSSGKVKYYGTHISKGHGSRDGVAILYRTDRFSFVKTESIAFSTKDKRLADCSQVAVYVELRVEPYEYGTVGTNIGIVGTHLKAKESATNKEIRRLEAVYMSRWIREVSKPLPVGASRLDEIPIIVCGDFNDVPGSPCYDVMAGLYRSVYPEDDDHYTTFKARKTVVKRCIDYIFYTPELLELERRLEIPNPDNFPYPHLPCLTHPSDHLHLMADFGFK